MNKNLSEKIEELERQERVRIGVFAQTDSQKSFAYRADEQFPSASLIKLVLALAILKKVEQGELSLTDEIKKDQTHHLPGASILADLETKTWQLSDLLYFLLAHSDNTAQIILESSIGAEDIQKIISDLKLKNTAFVSLLQKEAGTFSVITPQDSHKIAQTIWEKKYLRPDLSEFLLAQLAKTRNTYFGLRYLPCRLNQANPEIKDFYAKSGKLADLVADQLILETENKTIFLNVFVAGEKVAVYRNNIDNRLAILIGEIALEIYKSLAGE